MGVKIPHATSATSRWQILGNVCSTYIKSKKKTNIALCQLLKIINKNKIRSNRITRTSHALTLSAPWTVNVTKKYQKIAAGDVRGVTPSPYALRPGWDFWV